MRYFLLICVLVYVTSCSEKEELINSKLFTYTSKNGGIEDTTNKGYYFFRHDNLNKFGFIDTVNFTEDQLRKKITLYYNGKARTDYVHSFGCIRIVLFNGNEPIHWSGILLRDEVVDLNVWNKFSGYFVLPPRTTDRQFNKAVIFTELAEGNLEKFDIDSVEINLKCSNR